MSPPNSSAVAGASGNASADSADAVPGSAPVRPPWRETLRSLWDRRVAAMLFLGFTAGLPILLIFSSLSLWLVEAGVERKAVTFFSWAALGYSFKFIWAPLVDRLPLPLLTRWLGRRRSYLLLAQLGV
ncbi:MAG: AmpG family muropeptide MFS transporter, partial [Hydrogenophaga sp.]|nr:AmpG family muropeptide MFS transporter [Hydrogenophaga sp.]